jgi:hypothetical protein
VSIARSFEIAPSEVTLLLQYFHRRGRLVYFADDPLLSRLVVVSPSWFVLTIGRAVDSFDRSLVDGGHLLQFLVDREMDRQLQVINSVMHLLSLQQLSVIIIAIITSYWSSALLKVLQRFVAS